VFISPCLAKQEEYWGAKIYVTEIGSNQPPTLLPIPSDAAGDFSPAWSPDGRLLCSLPCGTAVCRIFTFLTW
jgi:Tol biopolymer transport system component